MSSTLFVISWVCRIAIAIILLQTLFFKFTGAEESKYIFTTLLGENLEAFGRIGSGVVELIAAILLVIPRTAWLGAFLSLGTISGAIFSHVTMLGIVVKDDGGLLFGLAGTAEAVTRGGTLIYARYADSLLLDPVYNDANVDIWILTNLYDTLLQPTADGKGVQPGLASEYQVSDDGVTVTLKMRPDIKFSDGSPITVDDVKWSLDRARDPK